MSRKLSTTIASIMLLISGLGIGFAQTTGSKLTSNSVWIAEIQGVVEVQSEGSGVWRAAGTNQVLRPLDRMHIGLNSRVSLLWSDQSVISFGSSTELEILPPDSSEHESGLHLTRGIMSFFHRERPGRIRVVTRGAVAGVEGTEFVLAVDDTDRSTLSVVDGVVRFGNEQATIVMTNGQQAFVDLGQPPIRTAGFIANNVLQWCFFYPAVVILDELQLSADEQVELADALAAYRQGDLLGALARYPAGRVNVSDNERVFEAALLLSVGEAEKAEAVLSSIVDVSGRPHQLSMALRQLIAAVKRQPGVVMGEPQTATECLAQSYYEQARAERRTSLPNARALARKAVAIAPDSGFAWARVAELELSFGRIDEALVALERSLALGPANAQALATKGFVLAAQGQPKAALTWFERAIAADSALANAWLGRGLVRIRLRDVAPGREDLLIAAALEPQRAELRSYLGKAFTQAGDVGRSSKELSLAKRIDPNDPTAWLYSALLNQQENRINDAIEDLEESQSLNDNRRVYRSSLLLDQDRAVRSANLASIYRDAGMTDVSIREASRAVSSDYANYSAHLFLANSYMQALPASQDNARYETATLTEYLLANLLSPASAGPLSPGLAQQQRFRPFEGNRLGVVTSTEYLSRGAWANSTMQYGTAENFSYGLSLDYWSDPGQRVNNDDERQVLALKLKWQLTPEDSLFAEVFRYEAEHGDLNRYYNPNVTASSTTRIEEVQEPTVSLGYHHEWNPGVHTLLFVSRINDDFQFNGRVPVILAARFANLTPDPYELVGIVGGMDMRSAYHNKLTLYTSELQQIWTQEAHSTIMGLRYQCGRTETDNVEDLPSTAGALFDIPAAQQELSGSLQRYSIYGYHQWEIAQTLRLVGGLSYDGMKYPENLLSPPISSKEESIQRLSPKAGLIWSPTKETNLRLAYTRTLGSQNLDQSLRIEPVQVAGFLQSFRSVIPEPSVARNGPAQNETLGLALERRFETRTYFGVSGQILRSKVNQTVGAFDGLWDLFDFAVPSGLHNRVNFEEQSLQINVNQLIGVEWGLGAQYRISHADLEERFTDIPASVLLFDFQPSRSVDATLHELNLFTIYNHPSGLFARLDGKWNLQNSGGYTPALTGDSFWQFDAQAGYRFLHRTAEVSVGVLNVTDQDYRLNPLNFYSELPRERVIVVRFSLSL